jgi:hypothetical protein
MINYLTSIKPLVSDSVFATGIKLYLEGSILDTKDTILPGWKACSVHGSQHNYRVLFPIIHELVPESTVEIASNIIRDHATCNCPYFSEYATCKHLVAICAFLDDQNGKKVEKKTTKKDIHKIDSLIDTMFEVESQKKTRKWMHQVEKYVSIMSPEDCFWFDEIVRDVAKSPTDHGHFIDDFRDFSLRNISTFEHEKKIVELIKHSIYFGEKYWWDFWYPIVPKLSKEAQVKVWVAIWKLYLAGVLSLWKDEFLYQLRDCNSDLKQSILSTLQKDFVTKAEFWTQFVIEAQISTWLEENFDKLDPVNLLKIVSYLPDKQEVIEEAVFNHVKIWADFITTGNYDQIIDVFHQWKKMLGTTDMYMTAQEYIKTHHPKKKSLLKKIGL